MMLIMITLWDCTFCELNQYLLTLIFPCQQILAVAVYNHYKRICHTSLRKELVFQLFLIYVS